MHEEEKEEEEASSLGSLHETVVLQFLSTGSDQVWVSVMS
jgi:hypothetical protein